MSSWILQHFLNPALFWPGMLLLTVPIVIHLINRLRYRRVRFAAMEFLFASQKRSRRRILIEQLLLLLLRVTMVLLVVALIARFVLNPDQLSLFQGARSHHVILIDDSASMRDRIDDGNAFGTAQEVVRRIAAEGARRPGTQLLTLVSMSRPDRVIPGFSERVVDQALLTELSERLSTMVCTWQGVDPAKALEAAHHRLLDERSAVRTVHVLSDFRRADWLDNKSAIAAIQALEAAKIGVNLVRCVADSHENLGVESLDGEVEVAAAGVPVTLSASVRNWGNRPATNVNGAIFVNGARLPRSIDFQTIAPGETSTQRFDVVFDKAQPYTVKVTLGDDALDADNERYLAIDVPEENPVLIVDGSPGAEQASYIADALAADRSITGFAPDIRTVDELRRVSINNYHLIYLINVPELAPDTVVTLENYVKQGGGLIWYLGDAVRPSFYNDNLFSQAGGLFPVRLGSAPQRVDPVDSTQPRERIEVGRDPLFALFTQQDVPILDQVFINLIYPVAPETAQTPSMANDARILARLGREPLMLEHQFGDGHIFTCLTSAGPLINPEGVNWSNWANGPAGFSFVVLQLDLAKRFIRKDRAFPQSPTGTPIQLTFDQSAFFPDIDVLTPDDQVTRIQAAREDENSESTELRAEFQETGTPGVYGVTLTGQDQKLTRRLYAMNVPATEGALPIADDSSLLRELGTNSTVQIQKAGTFEWIRSESPGSEVRWMLLVLLAVACILEQLLAARLSFQSAS
ncbi:MAG TPA: BatA domain-containing protein [Planctomicrobium sp.]|nr:BatA domain-containing protein [Planctomicrobium sp.]